jgi:hypothetical protein
MIYSIILPSLPWLYGTMQSVPITTDVVSSNLNHGEVYNIMLIDCLRMLNTTFNNISVLLVEETGVPRENHWPVASDWQTLSHNVVYHIWTIFLYLA